VEEGLLVLRNCLVQVPAGVRAKGRRCGYRRDHLALGPRKDARREYHLHEQLRQRRADQRMSVRQH
jgi:hypothetical protein